MSTGFNQKFSYTQSSGFEKGFSGGPRPIYTPGIKNDLYIGYYADDLSWFTGRTPASTVYPTSTIQDPPTDDGSNFSRRWTGYFKPRTTETYTFYLTSDDASIMWIGQPAKIEWTVSNALIDNGGIHSVVEKSGSTVLVTDAYYPIQIFFGELGGGDELTFSYSTPTIAKTTNLTGLVYYNALLLSGRGI